MGVRDVPGEKWNEPVTLGTVRYEVVVYPEELREEWDEPEVVDRSPVTSRQGGVVLG